MSLTKEQLELTGKIVREMIARLGLEAKVKVSERDGDLLVAVDTPDPGRMIGRKGRSIDSLEYLVNRILGHHEKDFPRAVLDVDGHGDGAERSEGRKPVEDRRQRRERPERKQDGKSREDDQRSAKLEQLALDAAKEVKRWGDTKAIGPYNSHDRRIIHLALDKDREVVAETDPEASEDDRMKKMIIRLADDGAGDA